MSHFKHRVREHAKTVGAPLKAALHTGAIGMPGVGASLMTGFWRSYVQMMNQAAADARLTKARQKTGGCK